jgi:hypothetical protein
MREHCNANTTDFVKRQSWVYKAAAMLDGNHPLYRRALHCEVWTGTISEHYDNTFEKYLYWQYPYPVGCKDVHP